MDKEYIEIVDEWNVMLSLIHARRMIKETEEQLNTYKLLEERLKQDLKKLGKELIIKEKR